MADILLNDGIKEILYGCWQETKGNVSDKMQCLIFSGIIHLVILQNPIHVSLSLGRYATISSHRVWSCVVSGKCQLCVTAEIV